MTIVTLGHPLETLRDGVTAFVGDRRTSPATAMNMTVSVRNGLATVGVTRFFRNDENVPIEAVLTYPVAFDAILVGLTARIGKRELSAIARPREAARDAYEDAMDRGKLAVLHEEPLRGVHIVSVGNLAPGVEVEVRAEWMTPLACLASVPSLRIPMTVGELYGESLLLPVDDLVTGKEGLSVGVLTVAADSGHAILDGKALDSGPINIPLNRSLNLSFPEARFGVSKGIDACGRQVSIALKPTEAGNEPLKLAVLFDRSGSTNASADGYRDQTIWTSMQNGLGAAFDKLQPFDSVVLWQFDSECDRVGAATGAQAARLVKLLGEPRGGTELGSAVRTLVDKEDFSDILILTDGQTWAADAHAAAGLGRRITAVVVGSAGFDAVVGHLAAMTGGQLFAAEGAAIPAAIHSAAESMRVRSSGLTGRQENGLPVTLDTYRGGVTISISWEGDAKLASCDRIGRFAAGLALPLITKEDAADFAVSHGLCTHLTSLLIVDEAGETVQGVPEQRKIALSAPSASLAYLSHTSFEMAPSISCKMQAFVPDDDSSCVVIDWDTKANELLAGDLSGLEHDVAQNIRVAAEDSRVIDLANQLGLEPVILVIALLARGHLSRTAARIARKLLGDTPHDMLLEALEVLSLHSLETECTQVIRKVS